MCSASCRLWLTWPATSTQDHHHSPKVRLKGATHIEFDEHKAYTIAKQILRTAIDNYKYRGPTHIPQVKEDLIPGFSMNISTTCWAALTGLPSAR